LATAPPSRSSIQPQHSIFSSPTLHTLGRALDDQSHIAILPSPLLPPHLTLPFYQPLRLTLGPHASCVRAPRPRVHQYNPETGSPRSRKSTPRPRWRWRLGLPVPAVPDP